MAGCVEAVRLQHAREESPASVPDGAEVDGLQDLGLGASVLKGHNGRQWRKTQISQDRRLKSQDRETFNQLNLYCCSRARLYGVHKRNKGSIEYYDVLFYNLHIKTEGCLHGR